MNILPTPPRVAGLALGFIVATSLAVAAGKKNPTSKLYVADLQGQAQIDTGDLIEDLSEKSVHNAQGTVIETKDASTNAMVFSNGTGIFFDQDTRMEVKRFSQEPFSPNRTDLETEPSISQSVSHIPRGTVGLCTPKLVAGSTMVYSTPNANVNIRGQRVVIQTSDFETKISLVDGDVTVRGSSGGADGGGQNLSAGMQAIITNYPGQPPGFIVQPIPQEEMEFVNERVTMACNARRTVYFDATGKTDETGDMAAGAEGEGWALAFEEDENSSTDDDTDDVLQVIEVTTAPRPDPRAARHPGDTVPPRWTRSFLFPLRCPPSLQCPRPPRFCRPTTIRSVPSP